MKKVEISLKEILVYVLRRWKAIISFSLVVAVIIGGYSYFRQLNSNEMDANQATQLSISIDLIDFNTANLNAYTENTARKDRIIKLQTQYLIIAQAAPLGEILEGIAAEGVSETALQNQISVDGPSEGIINITVQEMNGLDSKKAADAIYDYLSGSIERLSQSVASHRLSLLASSSISKSLVSGKEPFIKNALYGLVYAFVASTIIFVLVYLFCLPIQIPEQLQRHLNIKYLGGVRRKKYLSLGDRVAGSLRMAGEKEAMEIIAANLVEFAGNNKRILITGTAGVHLINEFVDKISPIIKNSEICFTSGSDINNDAETITALAGSDAVVLIERLDISKMKRVNDAKERIDMSNKDILGYVLF